MWDVCRVVDSGFGLKGLVHGGWVVAGGDSRQQFHLPAAGGSSSRLTLGLMSGQ